MADSQTSVPANDPAVEAASAMPPPVSADAHGANGAGPKPTADQPATAVDEAVEAAERIAFLALASELARGRKVLVVDDGASALAGIAAHLDSCAITSVGEIDPGAYELVVADLQSADEGVSAGVTALSNVVSEQSGVALVRLPNRPEFAELRQTIEHGFTRSLSMRQHNWVASALFDDAMFTNDEPSKAVAASVRKLAAAQPGEELYTVILSVNGEFPDFRPQLAVTRSLVMRDLINDLHEERERAAREEARLSAENSTQEDRIRELEEELAWYDERELALRVQIENRAWALALVGVWARAIVLLRRARNILRGG